MSLEERTQRLTAAGEKILSAVSDIRTAVSGTHVEDQANKFLIPVLEMSATSDHEHMGDESPNIPDLIQALKEGPGPDTQEG